MARRATRSSIVLVYMVYARASNPAKHVRGFLWQASASPQRLKTSILAKSWQNSPDSRELAANVGNIPESCVGFACCTTLPCSPSLFLQSLLHTMAGVGLASSTTGVMASPGFIGENAVGPAGGGHFLPQYLLGGGTTHASVRPILVTQPFFSHNFLQTSGA